jgi:universal stress protein A
MSSYRQLLVAIDLTDQSRAIAAKSVELARLWQAQLRILHVLVPVVQIDDRMIERAREQLQELASTLGVPADCCRVATGNVKGEVLRQAREVGADLIVLGCRERHGLSILVNLTEDTVLHGAPCDVLAMRVR